MTVSWFVYVLQSQVPRFNKRGSSLPGFFYVGSTTDPMRRLQQHNGLRSGGGKYTSKHRNWLMRAIYGPYGSRREAFKAEMVLKRTKRSTNRTKWKPADSEWCRGLGAEDPLVAKINEAMLQQFRAKSS